ncbi:TIGR02391 family protein [Bradyrhizobium sp. GCM10027634]|uniref:TIGR02391 family protein n=1 Tax=unclassified Bradyrhizobium TaxID=2631580 RepID=UPI00263BB977|nr:TIGR02391 family protein [Bradyrhizobium sp. WYCCWR 12677]MDN5003977.1 TIGR02391 family protein [Bradyrhizobium sp. WYCCWR 12677]
MAQLPEVLPLELLLTMEPEELAVHVLLAMKGDPSSLHQANFTSSLFQGSGQKYHGRNDAVEVAIAEAWNWLEVQGLLVPAPGTNGANGWKIFSRRAQKMQSADDVTAFARSRRVPKESLHPRIAEKVWSAFMRSEFDVAAFLAMKAVEVYVREAGGFKNSDIGQDLMRRAFHEDNGPLTDPAAERSERQARSALFAGAIGCYKNPHSHRDVDINGPDEALEIVLLANHLLRIVDGRESAMTGLPPRTPE